VDCPKIVLVCTGFEVMLPPKSPPVWPFCVVELPKRPPDCAGCEIEAFKLPNRLPDCAGCEVALPNKPPDGVA